MAQNLGTKVKVTCTAKGGGKVSFSFENIDELRYIVSLLQSK